MHFSPHKTISTSLLTHKHQEFFQYPSRKYCLSQSECEERDVASLIATIETRDVVLKATGGVMPPFLLFWQSIRKAMNTENPVLT